MKKTDPTPAGGWRTFRSSMSTSYYVREATQQRDPLTAEVIGAAIAVHRCLGPGLLESAYRECLCCELGLRGLAVVRERMVPLTYKGIRIDVGYRADLVINERVLVELKSVDRLATIHTIQVTTYLRLSGLRVGLLINFNVPLLREGIVRLVV
jgi:GxxExxY protein